MTPRLVLSHDGIDVWHGDCLLPETAEMVMAGRKAALLHVDAPYSSKTHDGHDGAAAKSTSASKTWLRANGYTEKKITRRDIDYSHWSTDDVERFCGNWIGHVDGWATTVTDHILAPQWEASFSESRVTFPPLPWVELGSRVRLAGDGPSSWTCWLIVARPRREPWSKWGTLPGAYIQPAENKQNRPERIIGGKSLPGTLAFLGDYSRRGDLVLDPCGGGGTTAIACRMSGRQCITVEKDEGRVELIARLVRNKREQMGMFA